MGRIASIPRGYLTLSCFPLQRGWISKTDANFRASSRDAEHITPGKTKATLLLEHNKLD